MKSFGRQLDELMKLVLEGDLEKVKEHVESMPCSYRRPVLESTAVLSFKRGANNEIVAWLASERGRDSQADGNKALYQHDQSEIKKRDTKKTRRQRHPQGVVI
jgi:hypothetical protein